MRTQNSIKNLITVFIGQLFGIIISFISRIFFIKYLGSEYLGIDGLFTNILTILSLAELGVGSAMTFSLYKPIADNNIEKIKSLMHLYKITYRIIGIVVILLGIIMIPFYRNFIDKVPSINNLNIIFILFVLNTAISYFYAYKKSLIICNQKKYITTIVKYICYFVMNLLQIILLAITRNYIIFLICQIVFTLIENIANSIQANKMYPYLKDKKINKLEMEEKDAIKKNVFAMLFHKLGSVIVNSTDNIIISKYVGIVEVGIYSNYYMVTNALIIVTYQIFDAIVASVGNLGTTKDLKKLNEIFNNTFLLNFWVFGVLSTTMCIVFNDFITIWLGQQYTFNIYVIYVIVLSFYLRGMRKSCITFRDALGIFWYDRYKPIFECAINLILSIILAKRIGVLGIFIATIISTVTTSLWIEPYVLYKYGLKRNVLEYFKKFAIYTLVGLVSFGIMKYLCDFISGISVIKFVIKGIICVSIFNVIFIACFGKTNEFKYYCGLIKDILNRKLTFWRKK